MASRATSPLARLLFLAALALWFSTPAFVNTAPARHSSLRTRSVIALAAASDDTMGKVADVVAEQL
eukprot:CAMPEP_0170622478 /NCGR_PEP_ID=MMETSP0224-20130122/29154_1 /TAXON_ID=285029 /ORGANISM="Togula jolla, Strain CCCM 725" /LENGTH=65 /DNA_ID=CAMNT_0010948803 /DNA_START=56 /DNA_END=249 /DNA_ORIENTATION=+